MYRAITLLAREALSHAGDVSDNSALCAIARKIAASVTLEFCPLRDGESEALRLHADGRDISEAIRSAEVSASVSLIAADAVVRKALVARQRQFAERFEKVVAEGRDIGTVVFPDANLKIFLDADLKERARRRALEMNDNGAETTVEEQMKNIAHRDELDSGRDVSPLVQPDDAIRVDTSGMTIDEQVAAVLNLAKERQAVESRG